MSKVSVIIPTHNRAEFLRSAITSVLNQTYQDFDIIVVDDVSTDKTREIITSFDEGKITYIRHEVNKGDAGSRNTGILNSSSDYVAFLDDDDEWLPEKLQLQVDLLRNSPGKVGGVYTGFLNVDRTTGKIIGIRIAEQKGDLFQKLFLEDIIATSSVVLKRECFERVGLFDENIPYRSDFDLWVRIAREFHFECVKEPLFIYYTQNKKLSNSLALVLQGLEMVLDKYEQYLASNKKNFSRLYYNLGILHCLNGNKEKSRKAFFKAIELFPMGIKHYRGLALSFLGSGVLRNSIEIKEKITQPLRERRIYQELRRLKISSLLTTYRVNNRSSSP